MHECYVIRALPDLFVDVPDRLVVACLAIYRDLHSVLGCMPFTRIDSCLLLRKVLYRDTRDC